MPHIRAAARERIGTTCWSKCGDPGYGSQIDMKYQTGWARLMVVGILGGLTSCAQPAQADAKPAALPCACRDVIKYRIREVESIIKAFRDEIQRIGLAALSIRAAGALHRGQHVFGTGRAAFGGMGCHTR